MHVHFPELVDELVTGLESIPVPFDLFVTNSSGSSLALDVDKLPRLRAMSVFEIENHGRDILPLVTLVNYGVLDPYELLLKVHTKKSVWRQEHADLGGTGDEWRSGFLESLLGDESTVMSVLDQFADDPTLGLLTASGNILGPEFWGGDEAITRALLRRIGLRLEPDLLTFAAGSMYWVRGFVIQGLRALDLAPDDFEPEGGQVDGTTAHAIERAIGILANEAGYRLGEVENGWSTPEPDAWKRFLPDTPVRPFARALAFYLPQFHRFTENDRWWGAGFTEWSNVAAAKPLYPGHNQPLLPGELGFYDISKPETLRRQVQLAEQYGVEGFMYYYYWFAGKRLMDLPVEAHVASRDPGQFCVMWANENWTRTWDGGDQHVLIGQNYDEVPATQFIHDVMHLLVDERYVRKNGRPVLAVYRITQIPDFVQVIEYWRREAVKAGLAGLELLTVDVGINQDGIEGDPSSFGLDGYLEFAPHNKKWTAEPASTTQLDERFEGRMMSYGAMADAAILEMTDELEGNRSPGVMVNFDNTARRQWKPDMWYGSNPYAFHRWLRAASNAVANRNREDRFVYINAWNEWAESAVLEPTQRYGNTYLLATRAALRY
jgi:lipopolysaccharide biosynthesis protein